ncbi:retropepsin-like aspartic protease [Tamlana sp. 2_MG-2023]|uniref:retropepsin-like aspartic protease n=1 Tax=unclassified Tamlana TaxID=2614803 RepID=UPI0026E15186|nr:MULTISPECIES: retropepsin-like aspartic protease [unclassified Tamlana]MDO6761749.1 retropepsin-like aspartic protease [Tamlana sp. 2_MG-2023]MDO6792510.1 retropepsin-like aspartic protease [Tamlana sp. 1_MG-2023]
MPKSQAFTLKANGRINQLKTQCGVSDAILLSNPSVNITVNQYEAIWDTGATGTVITSKVATELGLKPTGLVTSNHAGGSSQVPTYLVNIYLPNGIRVQGVRVIEAVLSGNTEILIGMDIISLGDFAFTNVNGEACFSFRIPSIKQIDYVEEDKKPTWLKPSTSYKGGKKRK